MHTYKTKGTCSTRIDFDVVNGKVTGVKFVGGCSGNLQGIAKLIEGMDRRKRFNVLKEFVVVQNQHLVQINWQKL